MGTDSRGAGSAVSGESSLRFCLLPEDQPVNLYNKKLTMKGTTISRCFLNVICLVCVLGCVVQTVSAEDWPQFRGPDSLGISTAKNLPITWSNTENLVWKKALPGSGASSPISLNGKLYVTCYSGYGQYQSGGSLEDLLLHLVCLDGANGSILWDKKIKAAQPESKQVREHGYASQTPVTDGEHLYVFFGRSGVYKFDLNGKQIWQTSVGTQVHNWGSGTSPVLYKNLVIVNASVESGSLVAIDKSTGQEAWRGDITETHLLWQADVGANVSSPVVHDGHLYWTSDRAKKAYCLSLADGSIKYEQSIEDQPYASTLLADGKLYVVTRFGGTLVLAAEPQFQQYLPRYERQVLVTLSNLDPHAWRTPLLVETLVTHFAAQEDVLAAVAALEVLRASKADFLYRETAAILLADHSTQADPNALLAFLDNPDNEEIGLRSRQQVGARMIEAGDPRRAIITLIEKQPDQETRAALLDGALGRWAVVDIEGLQRFLRETPVRSVLERGYEIAAYHLKNETPEEALDLATCIQDPERREECVGYVSLFLANQKKH